MTKLTPIHPGEILDADFLSAMGISQSRLARDIDVPFRRVNEICRGKRAITADTALRLARYFGMSAEYWMTLQARFEIESLKDRMTERLKRDIRPLRRERRAAA
ncbi:MAG: HigA family addiction module antidote protein [Alphaproteobacteria bacterium]|nr:HigA family addiction module antidote protein [Alphaproteobacteria bacterium]